VVNRESLRRVGLAALAVLALAVAAATIDSLVTPTGATGPGFGIGGGGGVGTGDSPGFGFGDRPLGAGLVVLPCFPVLTEPRVVAAILLAFLAAGAGTYWKTGSMLPPVALWLAAGLPVAFVWTVLTECTRGGRARDSPGVLFNGSFLPAGGGAGAFGDTVGSTVSAPTLLLYVLLFVALAGSALLLVLSTGDESDPGGGSAGEDTPTDVAAVAEAAGEAADRIEAGEDGAAEAGLDNDVYRAWAEMTRHLDVENPAASTPAEFADAAVAAGMDRDDVADLTRVFEEVRYGHAEPTPALEERAVGALRRIEAAYGDGTDEAADPDTSAGAGRGPSDEDASGSGSGDGDGSAGPGDCDGGDLP
jgi:hypothetical protein